MPAFQAKTGVMPTLLNDADMVDEEGRQIDGDMGTPAGDKSVALHIDLADYFVGGSGDRKYAVVGDWTAGSETESINTAANTAIGAKVTDAGMLEYTLTIPEDGWVGNAGDDFNGEDVLYTNGFMATVRGTDNDITADATVTIMLNRKPSHGAATGGIIDASEDNEAAELILGVQDRKHRNAADSEDEERPAVPGFYTACAMINSCVLNVFMDDGDTTLEVVSMTHDDVMDTSKVGWELDDDAIKLTGMESTWDSDADPEAHSPVTVKLKATDMGGQSTEVSMLIAVNGPPMMSENAAGVGRSAETTVGGEVALSTTPAGLFTDPEGDARTLSADTSNAAVAAVDHDDDQGDVQGLVVTGVGRGTATITLKAKSAAAGLWQEATIEFTVTVK